MELRRQLSDCYPVDAYIPARVTNNVLTIAERCITPDTPVTLASGIAPLYHGAFPYLFTHLNYDAKSSSLNGLEIIPDSSAAHWAIDTQQVKTITPGQAVQLYVVDWYTGDADVTTPTWSIKTPFPGVSLTSGGLLTLAAGTYLNAQPIVVIATGAAHSASATLLHRRRHKLCAAAQPAGLPLLLQAHADASAGDRRRSNEFSAAGINLRFHTGDGS